MKTFKNIDNFPVVHSVNKPQVSQHTTVFVEKKRTRSKWIRKDLDSNLAEAIKETIAQEFFRLICPFYPKTRWAEKNNKYYVLSKEIIGFDPKFFSSPEGEEAIIHKKLTGLASAQILSLLLSEIDFKVGNVGIDQEKRVIKIDGGLCFFVKEDRYNGNLNITQEDIEALPALQSYRPANWLDFIKYSKDEVIANPDGTEKRIIHITRNSNSSLYRLSANSLAFYKKELNQTLLRICLLPEILIEYFTRCYTSYNTTAVDLAKIIITRKNQLEAAANKIENFRHYKLSAEAQEDILTFLKDLESFKTMGKSFLLADINKDRNYDVKSNILAKRAALTNAAPGIASIDTLHQLNDAKTPNTAKSRKTPICMEEALYGKQEKQDNQDQLFPPFKDFFKVKATPYIIPGPHKVIHTKLNP